MNIIDVYTTYPINKGLQEHQIRVATVAKVICDNATTTVETQHIVDACLLHDMGNLIKSKFHPSWKELYEPEGFEHWKQVRAKMVQQYGDNEDVAAQQIVREIGLHPSSMVYFNAVGVENYGRVCGSGNMGEKIAQYADMRVGPFGIITLSQRFDDIRERYAEQDGIEDINRRQGIMQEVEVEIFANTSIAPDDISDQTTTEIQAQLLDWQLCTK